MIDHQSREIKSKDSIDFEICKVYHKHLSSSRRITLDVRERLNIREDIGKIMRMFSTRYPIWSIWPGIILHGPQSPRSVLLNLTWVPTVKSPTPLWPVNWALQSCTVEWCSRLEPFTIRWCLSQHQCEPACVGGRPQWQHAQGATSNPKDLQLCTLWHGE